MTVTTIAITREQKEEVLLLKKQHKDGYINVNQRLLEKK